MEIKRSQLKEMIKRMLREGNSFQDSYDKWQELLYAVGADTMLDCIYQWASIDQKEQWIEWFEEEGYIESYDIDDDVYSVWQQLLDYVGADTMLDCLYQWASSDQSDQWIEWFEEEGYIHFDEDDDDDDLY